MTSSGPRRCLRCNCLLSHGFFCDWCRRGFAEGAAAMRVAILQAHIKRPWWTRLPRNRGLFVLHMGFHSQDGAA